MENDLPKQLFLFDEKIAVDKNFSFHINGETLNFFYDFEESFEEPTAVILDTLLFIMKGYFEDPVKGPVFTLKDYAEFIGRSIDGLRKSKVENNFTGNELERILYKLLNRNLIIKSEYVTKNNVIGNTNKPFPLLSSYTVLQKQYFKTGEDKRIKKYHVIPHENIALNLSSFIFYISKKDYQFISSEYFRNPNIRILYTRLCSLFNSLKAGIDEYLTFDEVAKLLNYDISTQEKARKAKPLMQKRIISLLELPSLQGLEFKWGKNKVTESKYRPIFLLKSIHSEIVVEKTIDKFKRLDRLIIAKIRSHLDFDYVEESFDYDQLILNIANSREDKLLVIFNEAYLSNFRKTPEGDQYGYFFKNFLYKDDYGNYYASALLKYARVNNKKMADLMGLKSRKIKLLY
jgi:hypothetical protein